jgi:hypothetical protein
MMDAEASWVVRIRLSLDSQATWRFARLPCSAGKGITRNRQGHSGPFATQHKTPRMPPNNCLTMPHDARPKRIRINFSKFIKAFGAII